MNISDLISGFIDDKNSVDINFTVEVVFVWKSFHVSLSEVLNSATLLSSYMQYPNPKLVEILVILP